MILFNMGGHMLVRIAGCLAVADGEVVVGEVGCQGGEDFFDGVAAVHLR